MKSETFLVMKEVLFLGFACFYFSNARDGTWGLACDRLVFQNPSSEFDTHNI